MKKILILILALGILCVVEPPALAQEQPAQQPTAEELEKEKAEREKNAFRLLDQVIDEAQSLRLTENRVRVQVNAADMLWDKNQSRARSLFSMAAEGVNELGRTQQPASNRRGENTNQERRNFQLRQELVLAAARHDAQLAYQLLATTKPPVQTPQTTDDSRFVRPMPQANTEESLEQALLGRIAALDPKLAAQNADQMMEKGQFPRTVTEVIDQLYRQDAEAGAKLADKTVKRLQGSNLLTNNEAANLAQLLLSGGIRPPASNSATSGPALTYTTSRGRAALEQSAYVDLLSSVIDAALKVTMPAQNNQRPTTPRGRTPGAPATPAARPAQGNPPTEAQIEQANARRLFAGISVLLPTIDQYLPTKAPMVRQKLTEAGVPPPANPGLAQSANILFDNNTSADTLLQLATTVPSQMQPRVYQQAAYRAIDEGNIDRARQIAADHLPTGMRDGVMRRAEVRELTMKDTTRIDEIRQNLARLQTDNEKIDFLIQVANDAKKTKPKLAAQLLEEAKQITNRRATSYEHFEQQLKVARAFSSLDPARTFEVLDPGISQLNELLSAAAILNGFEINMFRDGELSMQGGNGLTSTINRFAQELANLARTDMERSETLAGRFQMTEPRIMTKMAIVQGLLRTTPTPTGPNLNPMRGVGQNVNAARPD